MNIEVGRHFTTEVTAFDSEGRGICRIDGFTIFVENGVFGDKLKIEITKLNKTYGFGRIVQITAPSVHRVEPLCPHFGDCGACQLMHIDYEFQLEMKRKIVSDALSKIGGFRDIEVLPTIRAEEKTHYRNKSQFPVCNRNGKTAIGFYKKMSHHVVDIDDCLVSNPACKEIIKVIRFFMAQHKLTAYDEKTNRGLVRHVFVRNSHDSSEIMVVIVVNALKIPFVDELLSMLTKRVGSITSIVQNINTKKTNLILGEHTIPLWGKEYISDTLYGKTFQISPQSFYQVNRNQAQKLYHTAIEFAGITKEDTVYDLYSGIGTITLAMANEAKRVIGVEYVREAVENAKDNAKRNGIENVEFHQGAAEKIMPFLYKEGIIGDVVVLDPPRKGADEILLKTILDMKPKKIVYVSCNPATLARDLKFLGADGGYTLKTVQPVDLFIGSCHVETCALLCRCM